jgi:hypothetical protein
MNWKYFNPKFEYEEKFQDAGWPWAGHKYFTYDLIANIKPKKIVELGTHYGTSLWSFSQAVKDEQIDAEINAIDTWIGEAQAGFYGEEVFEMVNDIKDRFYSNLKINLIRKTFDEAISNFEDNSIDILHIDGLHTYEAVKHDFENWLPKVKNDGIVLLHDIVVNKDEFGVYKFWMELKNSYSTMEFLYSYGLGVLFKEKNNLVFNLKNNLEPHYSCLLEDIENAKIKKLLHDLGEKEKIIQNKINEIEKIKLDNQEIWEKDQEIQIKNQEIELMKSSKFWKLRENYINLKNKLKIK